MARNYGGKKSFMIPTLIKPAAGHLGTYCCMLKPGDTQHMFFTDNDVGPFWMIRKKESSIDLTGKRLLRALREGKQRKNLLGCLKSKWLRLVVKLLMENGYVH
jgi:hypothetical protein